MGASPQSKMSRIAMNTYGRVGDEAYGKGIGVARDLSKNLQTDLQRWEAGGPEYYKQGYDAQRAALTDQLMMKERQGIGAQLAQAKPAIAGGNTSAALTGTQYGSRLADELMQSNLMQDMGAINQTTGTIKGLFGQASDVGSASMQAGQLQLENIARMSPINPALATGLGIANAAGAGYGAWANYQSQGGFGASPYLGPQAPPQGRSFSGNFTGSR